MRLGDQWEEMTDLIADFIIGVFFVPILAVIVLGIALGGKP